MYEEIKSYYRRKNRDKDIVEGIDILYHALNNYIDGVSVIFKD